MQHFSVIYAQLGSSIGGGQKRESRGGKEKGNPWKGFHNSPDKEGRMKGEKGHYVGSLLA